jgi:hypothetical protein
MEQRGRGKPFVKGQSGNPKGRPKGLTKAAKLRAAIENDLADILDAMTAAAKAGDTAAAKLLLDRCLPAYKPVDPAVGVTLRGTLVERATALLEHATAGSVPANLAADLIAALANVGKLQELTEFEARLRKLEESLP